MDKIKRLIEKKGLKLMAVAKMLGISRTTLWWKLNNKSEFTRSEMQKLADILSCSISEVYADVDKPQREN